MHGRHHLQTDTEDSSRWQHLALREGDIVVATPSKSGTTWVQTICALLVFGTPDLPGPLSTLSPWIDRVRHPIEDLTAALEAQTHRRILKTHSPLWAIPQDPRVTYVVVGRHPLDIAVSMYHHQENLRPEWKAEPGAARPALRDWVVAWVQNDAEVTHAWESLDRVVDLLSDAWRRVTPNVVLYHYADLLDDLPGQMRRLAEHLEISVSEEVWPSLVDSATFDSMRSRSNDVIPISGVFQDTKAFFRSGRSGAGPEVLSTSELATYQERVRELAPPELIAWLHR